VFYLYRLLKNKEWLKLEKRFCDLVVWDNLSIYANCFTGSDRYKTYIITDIKKINDILIISCDTLFKKISFCVYFDFEDFCYTRKANSFIEAIATSMDKLLLECEQ
jgi:hypothetical protein